MGESVVSRRVVSVKDFRGEFSVVKRYKEDYGWIVVNGRESVGNWC